jgi:hypothetical protein
MRQEGPQIYLSFKFKTSLFFADNIGERPSYSHLIFSTGIALSSADTSIRISLILVCTLVPIYVYHLIKSFTVYNIL